VGSDFLARFRDGSVPRLTGVPGAPLQRRQAGAALREVFIAPPPESSGNGPSCDFAVPLVPGQFR
jgi:hypothetical protein